jgi:hypothetical protein
MQTQHPGAYRRSARPSSGRGMKKENGRKQEVKKMKISEATS